MGEVRLKELDLALDPSQPDTDINVPEMSLFASPEFALWVSRRLLVT
jgi:hypothetical protein